MLTTSPITKTLPFLRSTRPISSVSVFRTLTVSHQSKLYYIQSRAQSNISKSFPEAMDAIKQTVAQNLGIGVRALDRFLSCT